MHPILEEFLELWVWPTAPGAGGAKFRRRITEEKCIPGWEGLVQSTVRELETGQGAGEDWKRRLALEGYAAEGVQFSIKQMSAQLMSINLNDQARWIDIQRMRARQVWDECKHSKLHVDSLSGHGWIKGERELMGDVDANFQPLSAYFGQSMMFTHIHPLARNAQHYFIEAGAYLTICIYDQMVEDLLVRHQHLSQKAEELMHFMEGKYQIDTYCTTPETQNAVEETLEWVLRFFQGRV
ncbi:MAG TPA: hypothetical protein VMV15_09225 [Candidatus Binataceae bacterium]|nr:hypothetical protein [Candidatus Binataceae bacterium]